MSAFDKVIGYETIKNELLQICDMIHNQEVYTTLGAKMPQGVLLYGDPGLGKTLMAKCFIAESGLKSYTVRKNKGSDDFVGEIGEADLEAANFDGDVFGLKEGETSLFKRLQRNDITQIKLIYSDKTEEEFSAVWEDADRGGYTNLLQSSTVDDDGTICVRITGETK